MEKKIQILYESDDLIVFNKPAGYSVNKIGRGEMSIQSWVEKNSMVNTDGTGKLFRSRVGMCHRLDKETTGCLVFAKNEASMNFVMDQFRKRKIRKVYLALVHGVLDPVIGSVNLPLRRNKKGGQIKFEIGYDGKRASTSWKVIKSGKIRGFPVSLVELRPISGRTHQIRVHMASLSHPIFGDAVYLSRRQSDEDRKLIGHHYLHASKIGLNSLGGKSILVEAPIDKEEKKILSMLE